MNIKQFVEDSERQFDEKFPYVWQEWDKDGINSHNKMSDIKSFTSSKLRELIGEVVKEVDDVEAQYEHEQSTDQGRQGFNDALNHMRNALHLLDEAGGGK